MVMAYGFYYLDSTTIYLQVGLSSEREAREGLERIAFIFHEKGKSAKGRVDEIKDRKIKVIEEYNIKYEEGNLRLKKKDHNKTRANGIP